MLKTEKLISIKKTSKNVVSIVREHYLRNDIPCKSGRCDHCEKPPGITLLPSDTTHYVIPDCEVTKKYFEIFQLKELTGLIFLQTVKNFVQHSCGRNTYKQFNNLIKDASKYSILFNNEFHNECYIERKHGDDVNEWKMKIVYHSAFWYMQHLNEAVPIIIITENENAKKEYGSKTPQLFILSMAEYISGFWPQLTEAHDLLESLNMSSSIELNVGAAICKDFQEYYHTSVLQSGIKSGQFFSNYLKVNKHNPVKEAFLQISLSKNSQNTTSTDILIPGTAFRNRSIDGDLVVVELLPKDQWHCRSSLLVDTSGESIAPSKESTVMMTGRVVGILQRNLRDFVVAIPDGEESGKRNAEKILTIPWDVKIPKIRISTRQASKLRECRFIVRIDSWDMNSLYPNGHFVKSLGPIGSIETEIATILTEHALVVAPFSEGISKEMPIRTRGDFWEMEEDEVKRRRDLRDTHLIFSIDPQGCEDVDDTLSVRQLPNGMTELGVHIADVTHFVKANSLTDLEARSKTTTVYLADRRYDMLPEVLSADLCSLISGVDRYAVSVIWKLDENYDVVDVWYGRSVIRSKYKLYYEAAQQIADGDMTLQEALDNVPELNLIKNKKLQKKDFEEMRTAIKMLMDIARNLKGKRSLSGAVDLESTEVQIQVDDNQGVKNLVPKKALEIHDTIAECMIFANHWVAKKIKESYKKFAILRNHPAPKQDFFESLTDCAKAKGFTVNTSSNQTLAESLDKCNDQDPNFNKILRMLATQAMMVASYFSTGSVEQEKFYHYGLALDSYTHFTSPIRRYADVLVHRLLLASVNDLSAEVATLLGNKELHELCDHINIKHREADHAQRESVKLFQAMYFKQHDDDETCIVDALVYNLRTNGVLIFVPKYGIKGAVFLRNKNRLVCSTQEGDKVEFSKGELSIQDNEIIISSDTSRISVALFSYLKVRISVKTSKTHSDTLKFDLVSFKTNIQFEKDISKLERRELIKNVKEKDEEEKNINKEEEKEVLRKAKLKKRYGQTHKSVSLYELFQSFKRTALLERT